MADRLIPIPGELRLIAELVAPVEYGTPPEEEQG
jgi:hypothetical protein